MEEIWNGLRLALRSLRHPPTFTVAVVATLRARGLVTAPERPLTTNPLRGHTIRSKV